MRAQGRSTRSWVLIAVIAAGLVVDAVVHFDLASAFAHSKTSTLSEEDIFRAQATVSVVVALAVILVPRWWTATLAFLVGASAVAAAVVYRYVNVGKIGPVPNMYDPYWAPTGKWVSAIAEAVAALAALALIAALRSRSRASTPAFSRT